MDVDDDDDDDATMDNGFHVRRKDHEDAGTMKSRKNSIRNQ